MGLDATVRCNCFEKGNLKPGPVPYEDLYIDDEGYLSSRKLDEAYKKYDFRRYEARYGVLQHEFEEWQRDCCEHEDGYYCCERVGNWSGCAEFIQLVEEVGGESEFPLLSKFLPDGNDGLYPVEKVDATLSELDRFIEVISAIDQWVLCVCETEEEIWESVDSGSFTWMYGPFESIGMKGGKVFFAPDVGPMVETAHFKQIPIGKPEKNGCQRMKIVCLDTGEETESFDSLGPEGSPKVEREFHVISKAATFLFEGKYWLAERLRSLLQASRETGNPIMWC